MDATPDYSKCSLRELRDVAARIDKTRFSDRYALVLREIERRETAGDDAATQSVPEREPDSQNFVQENIRQAIYVGSGALAGFLAGVIWLGVTSVEMNPDSPEGIPEMMIAIFIGAVVGKFANGKF